VARLSKYLPILVLICAFVTVGSAQTLKDRISHKIDSAQMTALHGTVSPRLRAAVDRGRVNGAMRITASIFFGPSPAQKAALTGLIAQQNNPASASYHQWLTPEQYADRFGMTPNDISKVNAWLKSQGFTVTSVSRNRTRVFFSGTAAQMESRFRTELHNYMVGGEAHFANATEPSLPSAFAGTVVGLTGLDNFRWHSHNLHARGLAAFKSRLTLGNQTFLTPDDVSTIYDLTPLYNAGFDGTGQTIAVAGQTAIDLNDIAAFRSNSNLPGNLPQLLLVPNSGVPVVLPGDEVEADLDVEWAGGVARNATIIYIFTGNSPTSNGVIDSFFYAIDNDIAPVISISYGACEASLGSANVSILDLEEQAGSTQGQTVVSAVGDAGATDCDDPNSSIATGGLAVDMPAALQETTGVGGTTFNGDANADPNFWNPGNGQGGGSAKSYIPEKTWNDSALRGDLSATGGGVSTFVLKPAYQTALTPADGHRDVPDIAFSASPEHDAYVVCTQLSCQSNQFLPVGGTSADAPLFAGMLTLINQATENAAGQGTNVNPTLYSLAGTPATYAVAFHDVATGNNKETCLAGSTGCTSANSHALTAENHFRFPAYAALMLLPFCAVLVSVRRKRWAALLGMVLVAGVLSLQLACGGGSSNNNPPPPPQNLSIGWSAGTGYDLNTGLGSADAFVLANHWPGYTTTPAFSVTGPSGITMNTVAPSNTVITLTRTDNNFTGNVLLTCTLVDPQPTDPQSSTCSLNPTQVNNGNGPTTLTIQAPVAGSYTVTVTGKKTGSVSHSYTAPVTVN